MPYLTLGKIQGQPGAAVNISSTRRLYFVRESEESPVFRPLYYQKSSLYFDDTRQVYVMVDSKGRQTLFDPATGIFKGLVNASGDEVGTRYDDGSLTYLASGTEGSQTGFFYSYTGSGGGRKLESVTLKILGSEVKRCRYVYYGLLDEDNHGLLGDLKWATVEEFINNQWFPISANYYRYYTEDDQNGFKHGIKFVVGPEAYARIIAAQLDPEGVDDEVIAEYADYFFRYGYGRRVVEEKTRGGEQTYTFSYSWNPKWSTWIEQWVTRTTEILPDNSQNIVYTNAQGLALFKIHRSGSQEWYVWYLKDGSGRTLLKAESSAISGWDEALPSVAIVKPNDGLVHENVFYPWTEDPDAQPGGYLRYQAVRKGRNGERTLLRELIYSKHVGITVPPIYPLYKSILFQKIDGNLAPSETTYVIEEEDWFENSNQFKRRTIKLPIVPPGQNGSDAQNERAEVFDEFGQRTWLKDERGILTAFDNDPVTGAVLEEIRDVNTSRLEAPYGWLTPSYGGLHLITKYSLDVFGRYVEVLGPKHRVVLDPHDPEAEPVDVRKARWTVYKDSAHQQWEGEGYAVVPEDPEDPYAYFLINPVRIRLMDHAERTIAEIEAVRSEEEGKLLPSDLFPQSTWSRWQQMNYDQNGRLMWRRVYHDIPSSVYLPGNSNVDPGEIVTNYGQTDFGYDLRNRQVLVKAPGGTINWNVLNSQGWRVETWVGTNVEGGSLDDPSNGGAGDNNMVRVEELIYDDGEAGGDGTVTQVKRYPAPSQARITSFSYDFRGRRTVTEGELGFCEVYLYDNLDRVVEMQKRDGSESGTLLARSETLYDDQGRIFATKRYAVNPGNGQEGNSVSELTWYDPAGNVMRRRPIDGRGCNKRSYDGINRVVATYVAADPASGSYERASSVENDVVLEQTYLTYDEASNLIERRVFQRNHDSIGLGELVPTNEEEEQPPPQARVSFEAFYPDPAGRQRASATYGTFGGQEWERSGSVPESSDDCLVSFADYNQRGELEFVTDPKGTIQKQEYDDAGRLIKTIENFEP